MKKAFILIFCLILSHPGFSQNRITGYRYWYNGEFDARVEAEISPSGIYRMDEVISTGNLPGGLHILHVSFRDTAGRWSSPLTRFFLKSSLHSTSSRRIIACQYWPGDAFDQAVTIQVAESEHFILDTSLDFSQFPAGLHTIRFRFLDNAGQWSSPVSRFFLKMNQDAENTAITAYRTWLDDDYENRQEAEVETPARIIVMEKELDMSRIWKGEHTLHYQFRDNQGRWSSVLSHVFEKSPLPLADFEMNTTFYCDSTLLHLINHSVDADETLWDFGDGETSTDIEPSHKYLTPGTYTVSLTVTEAAGGTSDIMEKEITVEGHTENQITIEACMQYVSPSGRYIWSESGIYNDTVPNVLGCDSVITFDLTIKTVNTDVAAEGITLTAQASGGSFRWLDCQDGFSVIGGETSSTFTPSENGEYAVEVTQEGCTDTSACYAVTGVYILSPGDDPPVLVYPNPGSGFFTVNLGKTKEWILVRIRTAEGKILSVHEFRNTGRFDLMVPGAPGYYLLDIRTGPGKPLIVKVMKE
ncbi:MAG TPA: PKD domain-containing protein [Bacteroidetes bacterium]|nr:PKD domain-containing protein [Bacteroidota bacterium]